MRYLLFTLFLVVPLMSPVPLFAQAATVSGTVQAGQDFYLAWPNEHMPRACIEFGRNVVPNGTVVTISLGTDSSFAQNPTAYPPAWQNDSSWGKKYPPIIDFSFSPNYTIPDYSDYFTIGICANYDARTGPITPGKGRGPERPQHPFIGNYVAHPDPTDPDNLLKKLEPALPCELRCRSGLSFNNRGPFERVWELFEGTPFNPTSLYAEPPEEGGVGGKGGSLSPFGVVADYQ